MKTREDYDEDMQVLWHIMEKGAKNNKKSVDVMLVKIRELNNRIIYCSLAAVILARFPAGPTPPTQVLTEDISYIGCNMSCARNLARINYATKWFKYTNSESMVESRTMSHWKVCIHRICFPAIGFV